MAKRVFTVQTWTPVAVADNAVFTDNGYCALQGAGATQRTRIDQVEIGGQASASSPTFMTLAHDSTLGATLTALTTGQSDGPLDPATGALAAPVAPFSASTTKPKRSNSTSSGRFNFSFNAFGGLIRWDAGLDGEFWIQGNAAGDGEVSLSAYTGGVPGLVGTHIIYETT